MRSLNLRDWKWPLSTSSPWFSETHQIFLHPTTQFSRLLRVEDRDRSSTHCGLAPWPKGHIMIVLNVGLSRRNQVTAREGLPLRRHFHPRHIGQMWVRVGAGRGGSPRGRGRQRTREQSPSSRHARLRRRNNLNDVSGGPQPGPALPCPQSVWNNGLPNPAAGSRGWGGGSAPTPFFYPLLGALTLCFFFWFAGD